MTPIIYTIQNKINGKIYVGQTVKTLSRRWCMHRSFLRSNCHGNPHLQSAFNKYGEPNFDIQELERYDNVQDCDEGEKFHIGYLRFIGAPLYNLRSGGHDRSMLSPETGRKISAKNKGRRLTAEHRIKLSLAMKGKVRPTIRAIEAAIKVNTGRPRSQETKEKLSLAHTGRKIIPHPNSIAALKKGNLIRWARHNEFKKQTLETR